MKEDRLGIIQLRLQQAFAPSRLEVVDESNQHVGHAGHQGGGRHFAVTIAAQVFVGMSRVEAHRKIYAEFADMMPEQIHALRINIVTYQK